MSNESTPTQDEDERRIERLFNHVRFDELLDFASEVCLKSSLKLEPYVPYSDPEARVIAKLGARGLSAALNFDSLIGLSDIDDPDEFITTESVFRNYERYTDEPNFELVDKARQFGEALLSEAYKTLGQDVFEQIRLYRSASNVDEQLKILVQVMVRAQDLANSNSDVLVNSEDLDSSFYHPLRLSPKAIGVYPNSNLPPTCLGVSVIVASFLEQVGAKYLHCGVMRTHLGEEYDAGTEFISKTLEKIETSHNDLPAKTILSLQNLKAAMLEKLTRDAGYHAANVIKLSDGDWLIMDPNFSVFRTFNHEVPNSELNKVFDILHEFKDIAPGLEQKVGVSYNTISDTLNEWIDAIPDGVELDKQKVREIFLTETESIPEKIKMVFDDFFMADRIVDANNTEHNLAIVTSMKTLSKSFQYSDVYYHCFNKFVLWDMGVDEFLVKCQTNHEFLKRRIEDVSRLHLLFAPGLAAARIDDNISELSRDYHVALELGLPAQRIGLAVLSDFATYCDDELPPSFWLSNWPSEVPITDKWSLDNKRSQLKLQGNLLSWLYFNNLQYDKNDAIISEFISTVGEEVEGNAQTGS